MKMPKFNWNDKESMVKLLTDHYDFDSKSIKKQVKNQLVMTMSVGELKEQIKILSDSPVKTSKMKIQELRKVLRELVKGKNM